VIENECKQSGIRYGVVAEIINCIEMHGVCHLIFTKKNLIQTAQSPSFLSFQSHPTQ